MIIRPITKPCFKMSYKLKENKRKSVTGGNEIFHHGANHTYVRVLKLISCEEKLSFKKTNQVQFLA